MEVTEELYKIAVGLEGGKILDRLSIWQIQRAYNGCGASWMPHRLTNLATRKFAPAVLLHDIEYEYNDDRSDDEFDAVNARFLHNCLSLSTNLVDKATAYVLYFCVCRFGKISWRINGNVFE